jgi:hypothetical protein
MQQSTDLDTPKPSLDTARYDLECYRINLGYSKERLRIQQHIPQDTAKYSSGNNRKYPWIQQGLTLSGTEYIQNTAK